MQENIVFSNGTIGDKLCHNRSLRDDGLDYANGDRIIFYIIAEATEGNRVTTVKIIIDDDGTSVIHTLFMYRLLQ